MELQNIEKKSIHELLPIIQIQVALQIQGVDIAIPYMIGAPGGGKTSMIQNEICKKSGWNMLSCHFALNPIEEIGGLPQFKKLNINGSEVDGTVWTLPELLTKLNELAKDGKPTVFFLDDFHLCSPAHMSLGFEMFTEKKLRGFDIPQNVGFVLAGNESTKAGAKTMFSAIINRCALFPVKSDFNYWKENFALKSGEETMDKTQNIIIKDLDMSKVMDNIKSNGTVSSKILSFLSNEKYQKYFHEEEMTNSPWASPRSWTRLSNLLSALTTIQGSLSLGELLYVAGSHVSSSAASDYAQYDQFYAKLELDKVFDKKKAIKIPKNMSDRYIYIMAASAEFINKLNEIDKITESKRDDARDACINTISEILIQMAEVSKELSVAGLKEILITERALKLKSSYPSIDGNIQKSNPILYKELMQDVRKLV